MPRVVGNIKLKYSLVSTNELNILLMDYKAGISMDFSIKTNNLREIDGVWYSTNNSFVSYPDNGSKDCFAIEDVSFWFNHRNKCILTILKLFPPVEAFYDMGGGNGFVSKAIEELGICDVVLVEPGATGILNAKKRGVKNLICSTIEDAKFSKNSLPAIGLFDVIEHVENDHLFLSSINYLLQPEGFLYITVPAYNFLWSSEDDEAGHFRRYTRAGLIATLEESGFTVCHSSYFFSFLVLPIFIFRTLPSLLRKGKRVIQSTVSVHSPPVVSYFVDFILNLELIFLKKQIRLPFGGSCIVVAKKTRLQK